MIGELRVSEAETYAEVYAEITFGGTIPNAVYTNLALGTFTMPWAGYAMAEMYLQYRHPGYQHVQWGLYPSAPVATNFPENGRLAENDRGNTWSVLPVMARWASLTASQTVTLTGRVYAGGGGTVNIERVFGSVRMYRTDVT